MARQGGARGIVIGVIVVGVIIFRAFNGSTPKSLDVSDNLVIPSGQFYYLELSMNRSATMSIEVSSNPPQTFMAGLLNPKEFKYAKSIGEGAKMDRDINFMWYSDGESKHSADGLKVNKGKYYFYF